MTDYLQRSSEIGFDEHPHVITGTESSLEGFIDFEVVDLDTKLHIVKIVLCRNFSPAGGYEVLTDHIWLIREFLRLYDGDIIRPWCTTAIKKSLLMALDDDIFSNSAPAANYLFGIVEYNAKILLGWKPFEMDFFDDEYHRPFREMSLGQAIIRLKKTNSLLAKVLNYIDSFCKQRMKEFYEIWGPAPGRLIKSTPMSMSDRLMQARNAMLHGEEYSFSDMSRYLSVLYILFHYYQLHQAATKYI